MQFIEILFDYLLRDLFPIFNIIFSSYIVMKIQNCLIKKNKECSDLKPKQSFLCRRIYTLYLKSPKQLAILQTLIILTGFSILTAFYLTHLLGSFSIQFGFLILLMLICYYIVLILGQRFELEKFAIQFPPDNFIAGYTSILSLTLVITGVGFGAGVYDPQTFFDSLLNSAFYCVLFAITFVLIHLYFRHDMNHVPKFSAT